MTEPKRISPLLDGFVIGNAMNAKSGVSCHPAVKENTDEKYILKILSIPASQVQLDALLLTGAYSDPAKAMDYFTSEAEGIVKEAEILHKLSKLDGFLPFAGWQIVPKEDGLGNQVYLLGAYKRSLERHIRRSRMTHLEAVNLGLDLCQALAICRRSGYLYINLKPSNVFISKNREYRIGDIGFAPLDSLKYSSLPGKYLSPYAPPQARDPMNTLDTTYDTYSAGMILYQIYNDGVLPEFANKPGAEFVPPVNADYELSAIIMKAVDPEPEKRWKDPMEMGQALVSYMQRNTVNNNPISNKAPIVTDTKTPMLVREAAEQTRVLPNIRDIASAAPEAAPVKEVPKTEVPDAIYREAQAEPAAEQAAVEEIPVEAPAVEEPAVEEPAVEEPAVEEPAVAEEPAPVDREEAIAQEISSLFASETVPELPDSPSPIPDIPVKAAEKAETAPEAPVAVAEKNILDDIDDFSLEEFMDLGSLDEPEIPEEEEFIEDVPGFEEDRKPRGSKVKKILGIFAGVLILAAMALGGIWYYTNVYVQEIQDLELIGTMNTLTVRLDTEADNELLAVICMDTYGNAMSQSVVNGEVHFTDLLPNSQYKVNVVIDGFHKLTGKTSEIFNTAAQTNVVSFTAIAGPEDGSVLLSLVVDGAEPESWTMAYSAEGTEEKNSTFTGHSVTIKGLEVGKTYTFTLQNPEGSILTGNSSVEFTSSELVMADNLQIVSCSDGNLKVRWDMPDGIQIDTWTVKCYNDAGYEQVQENVATTEATFTDVDTTRAYTVEVTAAGMTQPIRTSITSNPITLTNFAVDENSQGQLNFSWEHQGKAPVGGWLMMYRIDEEAQNHVIKCDEPKASISPSVPNASYRIEIQAADSTSIFSNLHTITTKEAPAFELDDVKSENVSARLLKTPEEDWLCESLSDSDFSTSFASGDPISVGLYCSSKFWLNENDITALYVIRDSEGNVRSDLIIQEDLSWVDLWYDGNTRYGELDLPVAPAEAGSYKVDIYFNYSYLTSAEFTIE